MATHVRLRGVLFPLPGALLGGRVGGVGADRPAVRVARRSLSPGPWLHAREADRAAVGDLARVVAREPPRRRVHPWQHRSVSARLRDGRCRDRRAPPPRDQDVGADALAAAPGGGRTLLVLAHGRDPDPVGQSRPLASVSRRREAHGLRVSERGAEEHALPAVRSLVRRRPDELLLPRLRPRRSAREGHEHRSCDRVQPCSPDASGVPRHCDVRRDARARRYRGPATVLEATPAGPRSAARRPVGRGPRQPRRTSCAL